MDTPTAVEFDHDRCHLNHKIYQVTEILVDYKIVFVVQKFSLICFA
jgi:hypothetical protein